MDPTDEQLARRLLHDWIETLADLRATPDSAHADIVFAMNRIAYWSAKLHAATFGQIAGAAR